MMTNAERADEVEAALLVFAEKTGLDPDPIDGDGPRTVAGDMIAGILHWVSGKPGREAALDAVRSGIGHFVTELKSTTRSPRTRSTWSARRLGLHPRECNGEVWHSRTALGSSTVRKEGEI